MEIIECPLPGVEECKEYDCEHFNGEDCTLDLNKLEEESGE